MVIEVLLIIGLVFNFLAVIGLLRFPDVYTRLHASTKCTTFGSIFIAVAVIYYGISSYLSTKNNAFLQFSFHTLIVLAAILVTNPTGAHAIARAAHKIGIKPKAVEDDLK